MTQKLYRLTELAPLTHEYHATIRHYVVGRQWASMTWRWAKSEAKMHIDKETANVSDK